MKAVLRWLKRHRVALGYVIVAGVFTALALAVLQLLPVAMEQLEARGYEMAEPGWLVLLAAIPVLWFVRLHSLTDTPLLQQLVSATVRSAILIALTLGLTRISSVGHESRKAATVMVVDVSESVPDEVLVAARDQLQALWDVRDQGVVKLVTFADSPRVIDVAIDTDGQIPQLVRHEEGGLGTDLAQAMRLAYGLYPPGYEKRMIVVTDGNETRGNALDEVETAVRLGIRVHHLGLPEGLEPKAELMVQALNVPEEIEPNVPFDVSVQLTTSRDGKATCTLKVDKLVAGVKTADLKQGDQVIDFDEVRVREGGEHSFRVDCKPEQTDADRFASNNQFGLTRFVEEKKKLLYVEGEALYSRNFRDALTDDFRVDVRGAAGVPKTLSEMKKFKAMVVSDVPRYSAYWRENITTAQMHRMHDYVKQGGLLIFMGGQDSLGPGGYADTYLERRVLPVRLEVEHELETPRLAMVLVIDRSGSMSGRKIELAKKAARETVNELDKRDRVAVIGFDSNPQTLIKLTNASTKSKFDRALSRLTAGGGTNIVSALDEAFQMLQGVDAKVKHVLLLTDGQSNRTGVLGLVERAAKRKITVSTIAVGVGSARQLLHDIAAVGRGRYYYTESAEAIPKLFVDETREVAGDSLVEEPVKAVLMRKYANLRFLKGVDIHRAPWLGGFVPTQEKRTAEVIMRTNTGEPLLVRWKQGKGWVYVFTSDIKNKWGRKWLRWSGFAVFWRQLIKDGLYEKEKDREFPIEVAVARHKMTISTDAIDENDQFVHGVTSKAVITDPKGETSEVILTQAAAGRYEATLPVDRYGPYKVDVVHEKDGKKLGVSRGRATYPYAEEHLKFEPDLSRLAQLSSATGGTENPEPAAIWKVDGEQLTHRTPVWNWFLYVVLGALMVDILLRRIRLWPTRTVSWGSGFMRD